MSSSPAFLTTTITPLLHTSTKHTRTTFLTRRHRPPPTPRHLPPLSKNTRPTLSAATPRPHPRPHPSTIPLTLGRHTLSIPGRTLLSLVPLLWATFIICAKFLYLLPRALSPSVFNASRLLVSSLFFLPTLLAEFRTPQPPSPSPRPLPQHPGNTLPPFLRAGIELGALIFFANIAQISGLRYTDASRAAFLNQLSTVFVPLSAAAFGLEPLSKRVSLGAACALAGVALLTLGATPSPTAPLTPSPTSLPFLGDALQILAAFFTTLYVLRISRHARAIKGKSAPLVAAKVVTQALLSFAWLFGNTLFKKLPATATAAASALTLAPPPWTPIAVLLNLALVLWAGVVVSAATSWMQTKGQAAVPATEAAILYAAQPLWAAVIATLVLGETMGLAGMFGAAMIVIGTIVSSTGKKRGARGGG